MARAFRRVVPVGLVGLLLLSLTACGPGTATSWRDGAPKPPAKLSFSHESGAVISPNKEVTVGVADGTLESVTLASDAGEIPGVFSDDKSQWHNREDLSYATTYTLTARSRGIDGNPVEETRTFTTVSVAEGSYWNVDLMTHKYYAQSLDGGTFGVGQPIVAVFDDRVDRAAAEATLTVTTVPAVEGSWHWVDDREAHWRPQNYWAPGTKVTVEANIFGVALTSPYGGRELHGQADKKASFTIGQSKIAKIDNNTKRMLIFVDGQQVQDFPVSLGMNGGTNAKGEFLDWRTTSGVHIVTEKGNPVIMKPAGLDPVADGPSGTNLYYEEAIEYATRISDDGIYVHSAPWSVWAQGSSNQSHGCINVSRERAIWFYENFGPGDVVEIVNTGKALQEWDGLNDWNVPWQQWLAGSAAA